ncbi:MAG: glycosyltransferase family 2 protein [Candidatus Altarchaeaceae archaeon]
MDFHEITLTLYFVFLAPVVILSIVYYLLAVSEIFSKRDKNKYENFNIENFPYITVQIPVYNDEIAERCINCCANFDYPKDRFEIQVVDDSTKEEVIEKIYKHVENLKKQDINIEIIRRNSRKGFKAGALNNAMKSAKGEIFVVFDSDFTPGKDFLKRVIYPMLNDEEIGAVQVKMGFLNPHENIITEFASAILKIYNDVILRIFSKSDVVFLEGTGFAIRRKVLEECGGWNEESITEDADLSVKILYHKYKIKFLTDLTNPGEVPSTMKGFLRQQMRWGYGMIRAFIENRDKIFSENFSLKQKILVSIIMCMNISSFFVVFMTFFALMALITGSYKPIEIDDIIRFITILILTMGFAFLMIIVANRGEKKHIQLKRNILLLFGIFFIGIILSIAISITTLQALFKKEMWWNGTPKSGVICP